MKKYKEYKDATPERTINLIRSILTDLDILLLDSNLIVIIYLHVESF